jgi:hypothetical protein
MNKKGMLCVKKRKVNKKFLMGILKKSVDFCVEGTQIYIENSL